MAEQHSIPDADQRRWRFWVDSITQMQVAAYCDERPRCRYYVEVQPHSMDAITHYGHRFPAARYWTVDLIARQAPLTAPLSKLRDHGRFTTFEAAMAWATTAQERAHALLHGSGIDK